MLIDTERYAKSILFWAPVEIWLLNRLCSGGIPFVIYQGVESGFSDVISLGKSQSFLCKSAELQNFWSKREVCSVHLHWDITMTSQGHAGSVFGKCFLVPQHSSSTSERSWNMFWRNNMKRPMWRLSGLWGH